MTYIERFLAPNRKVSLWRRRLAHRYRFWSRPDFVADDIRKYARSYFPTLRISNQSVVIDLGANEGFFALVFGELGAKVIAFEPNPWAIERAFARCRGLPNVILVSLAVGARTGLAQLYFPPEYKLAPELHSGSASTEAGNAATAGSAGTLVLQIDFAELLDGFQKVDLLKIDIEGGERDLWPLIEAAHDKIDHLAIETHERLFGEGDSVWLERARKFIATNGLADRWRLDWP